MKNKMKCKHQQNENHDIVNFHSIYHKKKKKINIICRRTIPNKKKLKKKIESYFVKIKKNTNFATSLKFS